MDHSLCKDCKGFCCDDIGLSTAPHELENSYHKVIKGDSGKNDYGLSLSINETKNPKWVDIHLTYPMLVFTHKDNIHPDGDVKTNDSNIVYHYRCKHHNKKTKDCDIHEIRPMMCRTFPDNKFCGYRKVKDKEVIAFQPKWFKNGMSQQSWSDGLNGNGDSSVEIDGNKKEHVEDPLFDQSIIGRLDNISNLLTELKGEQDENCS